MTVTQWWRGFVVFLVTAAPATADQLANTPPNMVATADADLEGERMPAVGHAGVSGCQWGTHMPADWYGCEGFCPCEKGDPEWSPIGRVTCHCPPHPFWYGEASAIGLIRDTRPSGGAIATLDSPDNVVLKAEDAWPDFRGGAMVRLGRMFTPTWGIEYGYLGVGTWSGDAAVRDQTPNAPGGLGNLFSPFGGFSATPVEGFDYNEIVSSLGRSRMDSFELSLRHRLRMPSDPLQVSVFYGIRYIDVSEQFGYFSQSQIPLGVGSTQSIDVRTRNDLFGGQIGTLLEWHIEPQWWLDTRLCAGLYNNRASQSTAYSETGGSTSENSLRNSGDRGTVGAEVSLALVYHISQCLSTQFGYHFLWLDRVALAAENFETDPGILREGPAQLNTKGTIMYHGPFLGLTLAW